MKLVDREWMVWRVILGDHVKTNPQYWSGVPRPEFAKFEPEGHIGVTPYAQLDRGLSNLLMALFFGYHGKYRLYAEESHGDRMVFTGTNFSDLNRHDATNFRTKVEKGIIKLPGM